MVIEVQPRRYVMKILLLTLVLLVQPCSVFATEHDDRQVTENPPVMTVDGNGNATYQYNVPS